MQLMRSVLEKEKRKLRRREINANAAPTQIVKVMDSQRVLSPTASETLFRPLHSPPADGKRSVLHRQRISSPRHLFEGPCDVCVLVCRKWPVMLWDTQVCQG